MSVLSFFPVVASAISRISAPETVQIYRSREFENHRGQLKPLYDPPLDIKAHIQPMDGDFANPTIDWTRLPEVRKAWLYVAPPPIRSVQRADRRGGDLIKRSDESWWLVDAILEDYAQPGETGWVSVRLTRQHQGPSP